MVDAFAKIKMEGSPRFLLDINQIGFSDSFIISVPLEQPEADAQRAITIVAAVMSVTAGAIVQALAHGVAIRGGFGEQRSDVQSLSAVGWMSKDIDILVRSARRKR